MSNARLDNAAVDLDVITGAQRLFDITVAAVALTALLPVMVLIAAAVYLESGRPIFFAHRRIGQFGVPFSILKFRKFRADCSADGLQLTLRQDPRFTRVGRILALTKLDELPQFLNVLRGDMSIVGPRPESLRYQECFSEEYAAVLTYRPGIFGPSQVAFRHENALYPESGDIDDFYRSALFPGKARLDLAYYPTRTIWKDILWTFRGMSALLKS